MTDFPVKLYYEREFLTNKKGICEAVDLPTSLEILCANCRIEVIEAYAFRGCENKVKFILRSDVIDFRDIKVCGVHKRYLMSETKENNYYSKDKWYIVDNAEVKHAIKLLQAQGYSVEKELTTA